MTIYTKYHEARITSCSKFSYISHDIIKTLNSTEIHILGYILSGDIDGIRACKKDLSKKLDISINTLNKSINTLLSKQYIKEIKNRHGIYVYTKDIIPEDSYGCYAALVVSAYAKLNCKETHILNCLLCHSQEWEPSLEQLGIETRLKRKAISRHIASLQSKNIINIIEKRHVGHKWNSYSYTVNPEYNWFYTEKTESIIIAVNELNNSGTQVTASKISTITGIPTKQTEIIIDKQLDKGILVNSPTGVTLSPVLNDSVSVDLLDDESVEPAVHPIFTNPEYTEQFKRLPRDIQIALSKIEDNDEFTQQFKVAVSYILTPKIDMTKIEISDDLGFDLDMEKPSIIETPIVKPIVELSVSKPSPSVNAQSIAPAKPATQEVNKEIPYSVVVSKWLQSLPTNNYGIKIEVSDIKSNIDSLFNSFKKYNCDLSTFRTVRVTRMVFGDKPHEKVSWLVKKFQDAIDMAYDGYTTDDVKIEISSPELVKPTDLHIVKEGEAYKGPMMHPTDFMQNQTVDYKAYAKWYEAYTTPGATVHKLSGSISEYYLERSYADEFPLIQAKDVTHEYLTEDSDFNNLFLNEVKYA